MITPPALVDVKPGDPISSESWNNMLGAIRLLVDFANVQRGVLTVLVTDQGTNNPLADAIVTAVPAGAEGPPRGAVLIGGTSRAHQIADLLPGAYTLTVEAPDYSTQTREITMPADGSTLSVSVPMTVLEARSPMPKLIGKPLSQALADLAAAGFAAGQVIDSHGTTLAPAAVPDKAQALPVLGQFPIQGALVPKTAQTFVHVSAVSEVLERVKVPDLRGLSVANAKAALEAAGLVLGTTTTVSTK
jgi:hypothetical protein